MASDLYLGIDLGTSGCRAMAIDAAGQVQAAARVPLPAPRVRGPTVEQDPQDWWQAVVAAVRHLTGEVPAERIGALALDGTSGTVLLADAAGRPLGPGLMYNDTRAIAAARRIAAAAPADTAAHGAAGGLAKLLWLLERDGGQAHYALHQTDWILGRLTGRFGHSDPNNALKTGYDPVTGRWPGWVEALGLRADLLPMVHVPGTPLGRLSAAAASTLGLSPDALVAIGTTDSTAAVLATGVNAPGEAVTSLGSTLVTKVLCETPVFAAEYGVYSQPLGALWLAGGGSNSGGAVLRHYFSDQQMAVLTPQLRPDRPTGLDYYPLLRPGERFPINDPTLPPRVNPRPADPVRFFQGLLEGIAAIEARSYELLAELGAPYPHRVRSVGGGAANAAWTRIRARLLRVELAPATHTEAAYGAALLARRATQSPLPAGNA